VRRAGATALLFLLCGGSGSAPPPERVWLVFSPDRGFARGALEDLLATRPAGLRAMLVVEDWNAVRPDSFSRDALATISACEELGVSVDGYDPDAFAHLWDLGVGRIPALVAERDGTAHVAYGSEARISEVLRCSR
jgi:hypothetical protein